VATEEDHAVICVTLSADSRQLFAAEHVDDSVPTDAALQDHGTSRALFDFAHADCALRDFYLLHYLERGIGLRGGNEDGEASFIRDIERIEAENFASALHGFVHWDERFFQLDADVAIVRDFIQRRRQTSAGEVAQAVNFDSCIEQRFDRRPDIGAVGQNWRLEFQSFAD